MKNIFTVSKARHFVLSLRQTINIQPVKDNRQQIHHEQEKSGRETWNLTQHCALICSAWVLKSARSSSISQPQYYDK